MAAKTLAAHWYPNELPLSGSKSPCCPVAVERHAAAQLQQGLLPPSGSDKARCTAATKDLLLSGSKKACRSRAAKKLAAQWQLESTLLIGSREACCSVVAKTCDFAAAKKGAAQPQQKSLMACGSKKPAT